MPALEEPETMFDSIEDTIQSFKRNEFVVVLDSADRENEGDLVIAAEAVTTEQMAFMIRHTSGLICAPLPAAAAARLALPPMVKHNADPHQTAYTVTVDAAHPALTTGISAHDRALTCRTLAAASVAAAAVAAAPTTPDATANGAAEAPVANGTAASSPLNGTPGAVDGIAHQHSAASAAAAAQLRRPGHVLPLRAHPGGVRARPGHTEAAVALCGLAGLRARVGVISELVDPGTAVPGQAWRRVDDDDDDDGEGRRRSGGMLRRDGCVAFARVWGLRVCTIAALRAYVERVEDEGEA